MAEQALQQPRFLKATDGTCPPLLGGPEETWVQEAASQTYKAADLVHWDANGLVAVCTTASNRMDGEILGVAMKDGANAAAGTNTLVRTIRPQDQYVMNVYHSTKASAVTNINQLRDIFGLIRVSNKWHVDIENTTVEDPTTALAKVRVVGFHTKEAALDSVIGDTYGFVIVQFLPFTIRTNGGSIVRSLQRP